MSAARSEERDLSRAQPVAQRDTCHTQRWLPARGVSMQNTGAVPAAVTCDIAHLWHLTETCDVMLPAPEHVLSHRLHHGT